MLNKSRRARDGVGNPNQFVGDYTNPILKPHAAEVVRKHGEISLAGVRRTDLEAHLTRELGRYIKDPVVQARALIRVSVVGEVTRPGYYAVPSDLVLADALMVAGGATKDARVDRLRILRGNASLWSGNALQTEIARGATLEDLGIRAGDRIQVPGGQRDPESKWRILGIIVGTVASAVGVIALTHR